MLFDYLLLNPGARGSQIVQRELKTSREHNLALTFRTYEPLQA